MFARLRRDLTAALDRDPAARNAWEVGLLYSGVHAIWAHRLGHWLWQHRHETSARAVSQAARWVTGVEIHPAAAIGEGVFIDHGMGVVIGETAEVGDDVTIYHGVTLGGTSLEKGKRHPTLGDRVTVGAGAKILGDVTIGHDSRIGGNAVVVKSVHDNSVVVGVPGQVIARTIEHTADDLPDIDNALVPDPVGIAVQELMERVDKLEVELRGHTEASNLRMLDVGVWDYSADYSI